MRTITLDQEIPFNEALQSLLSGKCLGIRPGKNTKYLELFKPAWMNAESPDYLLRWNGSTEGADIRSNQYLEPWKLVIVDHRELNKEPA